MSSFQEIAKAAIVADLNTAPEMALVQQFKTFILNKIAEPSVSLQFIYVLPQRLRDEQVDVLKLCVIVEFGTINVEVNNNSMTILTRDLLLA